jgi:hypothetical protein
MLYNIPIGSITPQKVLSGCKFCAQRVMNFKNISNTSLITDETIGGERIRDDSG